MLLELLLGVGEGVRALLDVLSDIMVSIDNLFGREEVPEEVFLGAS